MVKLTDNKRYENDLNLIDYDNSNKNKNLQVHVKPLELESNNQEIKKKIKFRPHSAKIKIKSPPKTKIDAVKNSQTNLITYDNKYINLKLIVK